MLTCEHCREQVRRLVIHEKELWCSACHDATKGGERAHAVIGDEIDEYIPDYNADGSVWHVTSREEKRRRLERDGMMPFVRHTDGDKHTSRWI